MTMHLQDIRDTLCNGRKDFAVGLNQDTRLMEQIIVGHLPWGGCRPAGPPNNTRVKEKMQLSFWKFDFVLENALFCWGPGGLPPGRCLDTFITISHVF